MNRGRWWNLVVGVVCAGLVVPLLLDPGGPVRVAIGFAGLAIVAGTWFWLGPRASETGTGWQTLLLHVAVVAGAGMAVVGHPFLASVQAVAYPIIWTTSLSRRRAIIVSSALAASVAVGFLIALGWTTAGLISAGISAGLSLVFAIGMGLWISQIADESEGRRALLAKLEATQVALTAVSRDAGVASERERFSREIHDTVAQDLTGLVMGLRRVSRLISDGDAAAAGAVVADLQERAEAALAEARALVTASAAPGLGDGAAAAIERLVARVAREGGLVASTEIDPSIGALPRETEVVLVRVAQEALSNVSRHSAATSLVVRLALGGADSVRLEVVDDGSGFEPATVPRGFGLDGMRERLELVGGRLDLVSTSAGTTLSAMVPVAAAPPTASTTSPATGGAS
jgi:signal transduction histidine kinase